LRVRVVLAFYNQYILEALVIASTVLGWAVAHAVEGEAFQSRTYLARLEGTSTLTGICIQQSLDVASVCSLRRWETVFLTERLDERRCP